MQYVKNILIFLIVITLGDTYVGKTSTLDSSSFCYSGKDCNYYGRLYYWSAAIDSTALEEKDVQCGYGVSCTTLPSRVQGLCPEGWHLPSKAEFETLISNVGGESVAGQKLKSATDDWVANKGTDNYRFTALPAGTVNGSLNSGEFGRTAIFWTTTENGANNAYFLHLSSSRQSSAFISNSKIFAASIRCVWDN